MQKIKKYWSLLGKTIYVGERKEKNLKICEWIGIVIAVISGVMTLININQNSGFVSYTTAAFCLSGIITYVSIKRFKKRIIAIIAVLTVCSFSFTYYAITGVNEGFAILWTLLIPIAFCYFIDVKYGIIMLMYYELLFIILFYTPVRNGLTDIYSETFMNRFPMLYLCAVLINVSAMVQYHITMLHQIDTEEKLKETVAIAKAADNAKSSFLAQMSHEIRTPINTILGMNEMILRKANDSEILDYASDIRNSGSTLLSLINSILDFSKIEEGKMELIPAEYHICDVVDTLLKSSESRAKAKDIILNTDIDPRLPTVLFGDDVRLTQIISNLLTNAIKYTDFGHVDFTIKCNWKNDTSVLLLVTIKDTGIGIKDEDLKKLFNSFERLDITRNRNIEGTGLGMSIVTKLLDMMNSRLSVESEYEKGSTFSFKVYQKIIDPTPIGDYRVHIRKKAVVAHTEERIYAPEARILVVDDNPMNLKVAAHLLKLYGIIIDLADSGEKSLEMMKKNRYDIVFMDHMMPRMDGIKALQISRAEKLLPPETKVIALTANAINGAREMYLSAGFDDYLSKPIDTNELTETLRKFLPKSLMVKRADNPDNTEQTDKSTESSTRRINNANVNASKSNNTDKVKDINYNKNIDTVKDKSKDIEYNKNINTAKDKNNDTYNEKFNSEIIDDDEILEFAPVSEETEEPDDSIEFDTALEFDPNFAFDLSKLKDIGVDTDAALGYCAYDENLYNELLNDFVFESESRKTELNTFCNSNNMKDYKIKIHAAKSLSRTLGFNNLSELALELEHAAGDSDVEYVTEHHKDFIRLFDSIVSALNGMKSAPN